MSELTSVKRLGWSPYLGAYKSLVYVTLLGRRVKCQDFWAPAVEAMHTVLVETGYEHPCDWTGSYNKRTISGTSLWSWHSYGGAIDLDYGGDNPDSPDHALIDRNPHLHRRVPWGDPGFGTEFQLLEHQVKAVLAIRTMNGKPVWRWLGTSIGDTMHFEPACSPADIATGIDTTTVAASGQEDDTMKYFLAIFAKWSYEDLEDMKSAGYWDGTTSWYRAADGSRGPAPDDGVVNLVVHILANGNKDIPTHTPGPSGPKGAAGKDGADGTDGKEPEVAIWLNGKQVYL